MKKYVRKSIDSIQVFSRTFIERPRFAMVISIILTMSGVLAITKLPITQYPEVTPPEINVSCNYPGANAQDVMSTVATPMEDEINGVDDMIYMTSDCTDDGNYSLSVSFKVGVDRDMALVKVQNRVQQALTKLPVEVKNTGVQVRSRSSDTLGFISLYSPDHTMSRLEISDYANGVIKPALLRVSGIGDCTIYGPKLSMRVWLDPERMAAQKMNSEEVVSAISRQNVQAAIGTVGASPVGPGGALSFTLVSKGRLVKAEEFGDIIVRTDAQGGLVYLKDIARTEIGEQNYGFAGTLNGGEAVSILLSQMPGGNAIETMDELETELARLGKSFPKGMAYNTTYDATQYVRACIKEIVTTIVITFLLVAFVCYLFLQDWRATLVPCITIPVSLCATFIVMAIMGFSINIQSLFGLVLAIGTLVDDAIVVVERVQVLMETRGLNSREAAIQAMKDVTSAVIATTLVLLGIFVPVGFLSGITGRIYQQFSVTLSAAVCFSTINALTLSPALCSLLLKKPSPFKHGPFAWFNTVLAKSRNGYVHISRALARRLALSSLLLLVSILLTVLAFKRTPTSFLPDEDQSVVFCSASLQEGSTRLRTDDVGIRLARKLQQIPGVKSVMSISGMGMIGGRGESQAQLVADLDDWSKRETPELSIDSIKKKVTEIVSAEPLTEARVFVPPSIPGLGMTGGIDVRLQSLEDTDPIKLYNVMGQTLGALNGSPLIQAAFSGYTAKTPHLRLSVDRNKCELYKVPLSTLFSTLQNYLGSLYVNDVNLGTQVNRVTIQADWSGRATADDVLKLYVRSSNNEMVPVGSLATLERELGPRTVSRYNMYPAAAITVMPKPGVPSGTAIAEVSRIMDSTLPQGYSYDWSSMTYQEVRNSGNALPLIGLAILFGYLFLVAQYESWTIPLPVMLSIFIAVFGALVGLQITGQSLSIYAQLGLILLVGLSSKNAILIVEFAKDKHENEGFNIVDAAGLGAGERLRAVLMTAITTLLGTLPMVIATGAGAASRRAIGTAEFFGMAGATFLGIILVPGLYAVFQTAREKLYRWSGHPLDYTLSPEERAAAIAKAEAEIAAQEAETASHEAAGNATA